MLVLGEKASNLAAARRRVEEMLRSGAGWQKFREMVAAQGGDVAYLDDPGKYRCAELQVPVLAGETGYVMAIDAEKVGLAAMRLGSGREKAGDDRPL